MNHRAETYREALRAFTVWEDQVQYLKQHSNLPGPRGNLELAHAAAKEFSSAQLAELRRLGGTEKNTPGEFLAFCGVLGCGQLLASGSIAEIPIIHAAAADPRWRIREAAATALQLWADRQPDFMIDLLDNWSGESLLIQRAVVAAICEPRLLKNHTIADKALKLLQRITKSFSATENRGEDYRVLRKTLGYGWSVMICASPENGKALFWEWLTSSNPDIRWMIKENLKKSRLMRFDPGFVEECGERLFQKDS